MTPMTIYYLAVFGITVTFAASAVYGLWWSIKTGQFDDFGTAAATIFDDDEPIGQPTDAFPGQAPPVRKPAADTKAAP